jgi:hypothetical protein
LCHVRRGDYTSTDYYGLLTFDYYKKALETVKKSKSAVISDDQHAGLHLAKVLDGVFIDTADLPPFTLLKIMMQHEVVVSANSSLSWWGGYLSKYNGGRHLMPTPWLKGTLDEGRWLYYEGCEDNISIFE